MGKPVVWCAPGGRIYDLMAKLRRALHSVQVLGCFPVVERLGL